MEVIRDYKQLKTLDKNLTYSVVGFTRSHVFNHTHTHLYNYSINKADKLVGILWDNDNDLQQFMNQPLISFEFDEPAAIEWFESRGFDYLFIPYFSFIPEILNLPKFQEVLIEVNKIWETENYESLLGTDFNPGNKSWMTMLLSRHYFLFSDRTGDKFLNRTFQAAAPDGTWGFIYTHFWRKYCGGEYILVPLLRNENGLAFDYIAETLYSQEVIDIFVALLSSFNLFKIHRSVQVLEEDINSVLRLDLKRQKYFYYSLDYFCNEITLNKYVFKFQMRGNFLRDNGKYDIYRLWEYEDET